VNGLLLGCVLNKLAVVPAPETKQNHPAEILPPGLLVDLHLPDALADSITLGLGQGGGER
jgi:hypothetical protein